MLSTSVAVNVPVAVNAAFVSVSVAVFTPPITAKSSAPLMVTVITLGVPSADFTVILSV